MAGQVLTGVLRDPKHGEPIGTTRITDFRRAVGSHTVTAATSDDALNEQEVANAWKLAQKFTTTSSQEGLLSFVCVV